MITIMHAGLQIQCAELTLHQRDLGNTLRTQKRHLTSSEGSQPKISDRKLMDIEGSDKVKAMEDNYESLIVSLTLMMTNICFRMSH